ncbi:MDR family MFS transporter [Scopulibacillus cellulosilyticus]|uniref:MDR family MFS transporter n=1 Tax=Scopulibacillus cellulosilyticus TaxID=2665665 RepID=A0ABW2Q269_9BACL
MPKSLWLLIIGMVLNVTGTSFLFPLNTIYIHEHLGHSLTFAGFVLMLNSGAGIVGNLIGGILFDRIGGYKSILSGVIVATVSGFLMALFHSTWPYTIFLTIIGFGSGLIFPSMYALAGTVWPEGGRKSFNALYVAQNLGVALGASVGGFIASISFVYIFVVNGFMYLFFTILVLLTYKSIDPRNEAIDVQTSIIEQSGAIKNKHKFYALVVLCIGLFICWIAYVQWQSTISVYTQSLGIPLAKYSLLWSINGLLIVLGQPLAALMTKYLKLPKAQILTGIAIFVISFISLLFSHQFTGFLISMIILTLGEMLVWPAVPSIAQDLAPKGRSGFYQGFVNSVSTGGRMVGPLIGGFIVDLTNIHVLIYILLFIYIGAVFTTLIYDKNLNKEPSPLKLSD